MKTISILGCGWLGLELGRALADAGQNVKGSTTTIDRKENLASQGIEPYHIDLKGYVIQGPIERLLECDVLIIAVPPGVRSGRDFYFESMKKLVPLILEASVSQVILISSTSVYGTSNTTVDENTPAIPKSESGKMMLKTEELFIGSDVPTTILRLGGLFGGDRHPVRYLAGKTNLDNGSSPVNLIHREDAIGLILALINHNIIGEVINGVADDHPEKREYYTKAARQLGLEVPIFSDPSEARWKIVDNAKAKDLLSYRFKHKLL